MTFESLSDHDFELLIADLFGAADGLRYEAFARGPDLGVDLRHIGVGGLRVIQCKHYLNSSVATLRRAARDEAAKLSRANITMAHYRFVTSRRLTHANKKNIVRDLAP